MIYQQGKQTMTIIVRGEGVNITDSTEKRVDESPKEAQEEQQETTTKTKRKMSHRVKMITITHAVATGISLANSATNYYIGDIAGTTGDKNYAELVQRKVEMGKDVLDVAVATTMSAYYGSRGGFWVGVATAAMGFTTAVTSKANKYLNRDREYHIETFKMDNEIEYNRSRANINLTTGRLR